MKIVYAGSPEYAVPPLKKLVESGFEVVAAVTQPDRPWGRKRVLTPTPVKTAALELGIKVFDFEKIRGHVEELGALGADLMITCAYGQLLTQAVLDIFPLGVFNLHASLLPKYRGASPIQAAIREGEEYTGVTVMKTELTLDSGPVLLKKSTPIGDKTYGELSEELSALSAEAAVEAVRLIEGGDFSLTPQNGEITFCKKLCKEEGRVDFNAPAFNVARLINSMSPSPAAFGILGGAPVNLLAATPVGADGECGKVISADKKGVLVACKEGAVNITRLQFAGGKVIAAADAVNGRKLKAGDHFD